MCIRGTFATKAKWLLIQAIFTFSNLSEDSHSEDSHVSHMGTLISVPRTRGKRLEEDDHGAHRASAVEIETPARDRRVCLIND